MTVQWISAQRSTEDSLVSYWTFDGQPVRTQAPVVKPYPRSNLFVFRTELTGLKPGTEYVFEVGRSTSRRRFRTMPAKATDTIHFISGGDCGTNEHTIANNIQAARQDPMFAVIGGDLGYDNGRLVEVSVKFIQNYARHMIGKNGRLIPLIAGIGNHEIEEGYGQPRAKAPFFFALFDGLYKDTSYATLDFGDYLSLVLLDTGHNCLIAGEQTDWLGKTLQSRADHPHVLAVNHVPAYPSFRKIKGADGEKGTGAGNRQHWVPLFEKFRVPVILEHHDHTFKRSRPLLDGLTNKHGVLYLGDGSWGRLRTPQKPEKLTYLERTSCDYHLSLHRIEGNDRYHLALDEFGRVMDVCHSGQRRTGAVAMPGS